MGLLDFFRRRGKAAASSAPGIPVPEMPVADAPASPAGAAARALALAQDRLAGGRAVDAIALAEQAVTECPDAAICGGAAAVLEQAGDSEAAADMAHLALHRDPQRVETRTLLVRVLSGLGRFDEARDVVRDAGPEVRHLASGDLFAAAGALEFRCGNLDAAVCHYRRALELRDDRASDWTNLGFAQYRLGRWDDARVSYGRALTLAPDLPEAHHNRALLDLGEGRAATAADGFRRALECDPRLAESMSGLGHACRDQGDLTAADQWYGRALDARPSLGDAVLNRCYLALLQGDFERGWHAYEGRFHATGELRRDFGIPAWDGSALDDRTILVHAEQGIGDEILFAGWIPQLVARAGRVILDCSARLAPLFRRAFPDVVVHGGAKTDGHDWIAGLGRIDFAVSAGSLPLRLGPPFSPPRPRVAYLRSDAAREGAWRERIGLLGNGLKVGLSWRGGGLQTQGLLRSIPEGRLGPLLGLPRVHVVSLQRGADAVEIDRLRQMHGAGVAHWPDVGEDVDELAGMLAALDAVVTVDNTVAHLAGALGRPCRVLCMKVPEWRWGLTGASVPWYASVAVYRQAVTGDWGPVVDAVAQALVQDARR
jgi:Flp pilus assembly protein TadD